MRVLISGGPGSGCTSTAKLLGSKLGIRVLDSDSFFHKPTNPPFQEQYSPDERRDLLADVLGQSPDWILSGSIASWGVELSTVHFGVFMDTPKKVRMHTENQLFMEWAIAYEDRCEGGRNREVDRDFLIEKCDYFIEIGHSQSLDEITSEIQSFMANPTKQT